MTGRTVSYLLSDPINDGGQWDMAVNLVTKYGMLPKKCFPETFSCESRYRCSIVQLDLQSLCLQLTPEQYLEVEVEGVCTEPEVVNWQGQHGQWAQGPDCWNDGRGLQVGWFKWFQQYSNFFTCRIVGICLGVPPTQFTWEYTDKAKQVNNKIWITFPKVLHKVK